MSSDVLHPGLMSDNHEVLEALVRFKLLFGFAFEVGVLPLSMTKSRKELQKLMKVWKAGSSITHRYLRVLGFFTKMSFSLIIASKCMTDGVYVFVRSRQYLLATVKTQRWYVPAMIDILYFQLKWAGGEKVKSPSWSQNVCSC